MTPLLQVHDLHVTFGGAWGRPLLRAVDGVSLELDPGEAVGLVGESGCGKSTLMAAIVGDRRPSRGQVHILGTPRTHRVGHRSGPRPEDVQTVFQHVDAHINPAWTADALLHETAQRFGRSTSDVDQVLRRLGLDHRRTIPTARLSGGERRRLGLARVMLVRARLVLADEPCAGVDAGRRTDLIVALREHQPPDSGLLLVSHDLRLIQQTCHRVYVMLGGRIVEACATEHLGQVPHHPYTDTLLRAAGLRPGDVPDHHARPGAGCPLAAACTRATDTCGSKPQALQAQPTAGHQRACPHPVPPS